MRQKLIIGASAAAAIMAAAVYLAPYHLKPTSWLVPQDIGGRIDQVGAGQTVRELTGDDSWDFVVGRIGEGRPEWLELTPRLIHGVDGDSAETLLDSLAVALPRNPAGVLAVLDLKRDSPFGIESVCSAAFANNLENPPKDLVARSIRAVEMIHAPQLEPARNRCLAMLRGGGPINQPGPSQSRE